MNVLLAALLALQADGAVKTAVERGRAWLVAQQKDDGTFPSHYMSAGKQALVLWTLLECGLPADDKAAAKTLAYLRANGDPEKTQTHHANYAASMTLVALWRAGVQDRDLAERCLRYVRRCTDGHRWTYQALPKIESSLKRGWTGDNSNAQYGWLGIRAASLMGVKLDDDAFVLGEIERMVSTMQKGTETTVALAGDAMFGGLPAKATVPAGGWSYGGGGTLPTMTTGVVSALIYAWQEAEERKIMTDALREKARGAIASGIAGLTGTTREHICAG